MDCYNCAHNHHSKGQQPCKACIDATINSGAFFPKWRSKWCRRLFVLAWCLLVAGIIMIAISILFGGTALAAGPEDEIAQKPSVPGEASKEIPDVLAELQLYESEIDMLAKLVYAEARGVGSKMEKAAVIWCVLNRVDEGRGTISEVVTAPSQFAYSRRLPVKDDLRELARDVLIRWLLEKRGVDDVGRVLPAEYTYFAGRGGHNWFRIKYKGNGEYWDWTLPDPYEVKA